MKIDPITRLTFRVEDIKESIERMQDLMQNFDEQDLDEKFKRFIYLRATAYRMGEACTRGSDAVNELQYLKEKA